MYIYKNKIYNVTDEINTMKIVRAMLNNYVLILYTCDQYVSECSIVDQLSIDLCVMNFCLLVFLLLLVYFTCLFYGLTK